MDNAQIITPNNDNNHGAPAVFPKKTTPSVTKKNFSDNNLVIITIRVDKGSMSSCFRYL